MADKEHLKILMQGASGWNSWRQENPGVLPNLRKAEIKGIDLTGANLRDVYLRRANLSEAILVGADLREANLSRADLRKAKLSNANLAGANLRAANLSGAEIVNANLMSAILVSTDLRQATLTNCRVYGVSAWEVNLQGAIQRDLIITHPNQNRITTDDLEVAQFIYLLLNREKLQNVFNSITKKGVLILGRFGGGGHEVLQLIAGKLRELDYLPIIFDFERPSDRNYTETIKVLVGLSRFVIVDLSGPSVPQELYATVPHYKIPFVPIIEAGRNVYSMSVDIFEYPWVVRPPIKFADTKELIEKMSAEIIAPAEEKYQQRGKLLSELFNQ